MVTTAETMKAFIPAVVLLLASTSAADPNASRSGSSLEISRLSSILSMSTMSDSNLVDVSSSIGGVISSIYNDDDYDNEIIAYTKRKIDTGRSNMEPPVLLRSSSSSHASASASTPRIRTANTASHQSSSKYFQHKISPSRRRKLADAGRLAASRVWKDQRTEQQQQQQQPHRRVQTFEECVSNVDIVAKQDPVCKMTGGGDLICLNKITRADASAFTNACTGAVIELSSVRVNCSLTTDGVDVNTIYAYEPELICAPLDVCGSVLDTFCSDWSDGLPDIVESILAEEPDNKNIVCTSLSNSDDCDIILPSKDTTELRTENCTQVLIEITTDSNPEENWNFLIGDDKQIILIPTDLTVENTTFIFESCLPDSCLTFVHFDDGGDGFEVNGTGYVAIGYDNELVSFVDGDAFPMGYTVQFGDDCPDYFPPTDNSTNVLDIKIVTGSAPSGLSNVVFDNSMLEGGTEYSVLLQNRIFDSDTEYSLSTAAVGCVTFILFDSMGSPDSIVNVTISYDGDVVSAGPIQEGDNWLVLEAGSQCG